MMANWKKEGGNEEERMMGFFFQKVLKTGFFELVTKRTIKGSQITLEMQSSKLRCKMTD